MERLTNKAWRNFEPWECCGQGHFCARECNEDGGCNNGCIVPKLYIRLASIEDILGDEYDLDHLRDILKAEQAGRLVVLPCKVGAPVYTTHWWKDVKEKCTDSRGKPFYRMVSKNIIKKERFDPFGPDYKWLGKTVFLTREEAEAALAQEGGESDARNPVSRKADG